MKILEVCCADIESVRAAKAGGADRIELCSGLECGGLTPSLGLIRKAIEIMPGAVNVLIRPRSGDFLYSPAELDVIEEDIRVATAAGATGIVFGALTPSGDLDTAVLGRMIAISRPASFTLHRAFDVVRDPLSALDQAIALGVDRILTSGCCPDALSGAEMLSRLHARAGGRLKILAGAGINSNNVCRILELGRADEIHASCKTSINSGMDFRNPSVSMGTPSSDEYARSGTSEVFVRELSNLIHNYPL